MDYLIKILTTRSGCLDDGQISIRVRQMGRSGPNFSPTLEPIHRTNCLPSLESL